MSEAVYPSYTWALQYVIGEVCVGGSSRWGGGQILDGMLIMNREKAELAQLPYHRLWNLPQRSHIALQHISSLQY